MNKKEEVFTIGDKTNNGTISKFEIDSNGIRVFFEEKPKNYHVSLNTIKHAKKVLFRTEDGIDIYEGDRVYSVTPNFCIGYSGSLKYKPIQPCFLTKEKAEEYIFYNSPVLSLKEVGEIYLTAKEKGSKAYTLVRQKLNL
jgi:hypothetical protein